MMMSQMTPAVRPGGWRCLLQLSPYLGFSFLTRGPMISMLLAWNYRAISKFATSQRYPLIFTAAVIATASLDWWVTNTVPQPFLKPKKWLTRAFQLDLIQLVTYGTCWGHFQGEGGEGTDSANACLGLVGYRLLLICCLFFFLSLH